jgi:AmiR/NasT family two-component response regulator
MQSSDDFEAQLDAALVTRPVIEQAKGILVGVRCATPEQAYEELRHVSQAHNVKLNALAAALVESSSGRRPDDPLLRKIIWQEWADLLPDC